MNKGGPIVVIDDDKDDLEILHIALTELECPNQIVLFTDGPAAIDYLVNSEEQPFLILSDVNMHKLTGFDVKKEIALQPKVALKCIPYLFITTGARKKDVIEAYALSAQGFFVKPAGYEALKDILRSIISYWTNCLAPGDTLI